MRCVKWLTGLFFLMVTLPALPALAQEKGPSQTPVIYAASFPCERASTLVEHAICQNEDLAKRDLEMARRYQSVMSMSDPDQQNSIESGFGNATAPAVLTHRKPQKSMTALRRNMMPGLRFLPECCAGILFFRMCRWHRTKR